MYHQQTDEFDELEFYRKVATQFPSVPEKFPYQALPPVKINKNIEIEKSEAKSM